jgi:hypothetical protein
MYNQSWKKKDKGTIRDKQRKKNNRERRIHELKIRDHRKIFYCINSEGKETWLNPESDGRIEILRVPKDPDYLTSENEGE